MCKLLLFFLQILHITEICGKKTLSDHLIMIYELFTQNITLLNEMQIALT